MSKLRISGGLLLVAILTGCDAGITSIGAARIVSFTSGFPGGNGCAVRGDGSVLCRGGNDYGRLGIGTAAEGSFDPTNTVPVDAPAGFRSVVSSETHACALDGAGAAWCWGLNFSGQLGLGDTTGTERCEATYYSGGYIHTTYACSTRPVRVQTDRRFQMLVAQPEETCGLTAAGEIWCWGGADDGFGLGATPFPAACSGSVCPTAIRAAPGLTFRKIAGSEYATCGIAMDFQLYCWGVNFTGRLGRDTASTALWNAPTPINSSAAIRDVSVGSSHTCTITTAGALMCFGYNGAGQLGDGTTISRTTPIQAIPPAPFARVSVEGGVSCALDRSGKAWCWGSNSGGNLGVGNLLPVLAPEPVLGGLTLTSISVGGTNCGTASDGIWCWGQLPSRFEQ